MAAGLGQQHGIESSPDFPLGMTDYDSLAGADMIAGPSASDMGTGGLVHMGGSNQGPGSTGSTAGTQQHWSNLLDFRNGPLFWLALGTVLYLGLISLHVSAGLGRR